MSEQPPQERYAADLFEDSRARIQFQHDYTLAGFRTLFLLLGGAVVSLLTYAGHTSDKHVAAQFSTAFTWYIGGLVCTVLSYLAAYASQEELANDSAMRAMEALGIKTQSKRSADSYRKGGIVCVYVGIAAALLALIAFVVGSLCAFRALS